MTKQVGIYSGTFNPVHSGHIAFALAAKQQCGLDEVYFIPEPQPRRKTQVTPLNRRVAMLKLATAEQGGLDVLALASQQFTVGETLPEIQRLFPDANLTLLAGSDVAAHFPDWEGLGQLLDTAKLAIAVRAGDSPQAVVEVVQRLESACGHVVDYSLIYTDHAHVSSSQLRDRSEKAKHISPAVERYIQERRLYR